LGKGVPGDLGLEGSENVKKHRWVTVVVWLVSQLIGVAVWIGAMAVVKGMDLSPWVSLIVAIVVALPVLAVVNLILYFWAFTEYGGVILWGLLGGLLLALVAGTVESVTSSSIALAADHLDSQALGMLLWVRQILFVAGLLLSGLLAERVGERSLIAGSVVLSAAAIVVLGVAKQAALLFLALAGLGLGLGLLIPAVLVCLFEAVWSRGFLATVAGLYLGATSLGKMVGTILGPFIGDQVPGGWVVTGASVLGVGAVGLGGLALSHLLERGRSRPAGQIEPPPGRPETWTLVLVGGVALCAGIAMNTLHSWSMIDDRWPETTGMRLSMFLGGSLAATWLAQSLSGFVADLCDWLAVRATRRKWGRAFILILGALVLCGSIVLYLVSEDSTVAGIALIVAGIGWGMLGPSLVALVCAHVHPFKWGLALGLYFVLTTFVSDFLSGLTGGLLIDTLGTRIVFVGASIAAALAVAAGVGLLWLQLGSRQDEPRPEVVEP
jgi:MFS family permease